MNWSLAKKVFVTFEICLLTFSVYIGSAIYTAGIETVVKDFGVSQVAATLGLTLFVAGYGLGESKDSSKTSKFKTKVGRSYVMGADERNSSNRS